MTKERELIRDLVVLVDWAVNRGILRFEGAPQALTNAKQYLAATSSTDNPVLERLVQVEVKIEDLYKRLQQDYETADAVSTRLKAQIDALERAVEPLMRDSGPMNDPISSRHNSLFPR